jgi:SAM-dependent methyltransferase
MYTETPHADHGYERRRYSERFFDLLADIEGKEHRTIYDIGCSAGNWFYVYEEHGFKQENIVGLDQSTSAVEKAKKKGYTVHEGTVLDLPFPDEVADVTITHGVIHHTVDSQRAFEQLCRITKRGGWLLVSVYNVWSPFFLIVHRLTFPLRYVYWNITKSIYIPTFILTYPIVQIGILVLFGKFGTNIDVKRLLMDQVFVPAAETFSARKLRGYGQACGLTLVEEGVFHLGLMRYAKFKK